MAPLHLFRYPFDEKGSPVLTFAESLAAMQELERQLSARLQPDWRWCDLGFTIVERHPTYVIYEVTHLQSWIGRIVVMPYSADPPKKEPEAALERALYERLRSRSQE